MGYANFEDMLGETLKAVQGCDVGSERIVFLCESGKSFALYHEEDCCEQVALEDIAGDVEDLIGVPLLMCGEVSGGDTPKLDYAPESYTWSFYKLGTRKGYVTLRWFGSSNGYYGETATFKAVERQDANAD